MSRIKNPNPTDVHVGARVRSRRMQIGMSQEALAKEVGVTFQQIQKNEKGANRMGSSRLLQIANALKVPVAYFFEGAPDNGGGKGTTESATYTKFIAQQDGMKLMAHWAKLTDRERLAVVTFVRALAEKD